MTTIHKDITNFLEEQGIARGPSASGAVLSSYNPVRMLNLLGKLDHEDLEDLLNAMQDLYEAGEDSSSKYSQSKLDKRYDEGYNAGVDSILKKYGSD